MEQREIELGLDFKKDYISVDDLTAISSEGTIFQVGDVVIHSGDKENREVVITAFYIDGDSQDVIAESELGAGRISFLYFPNE